MSRVHDRLDDVMQDAVNQAPKEDTKKPNFALLAAIGILASVGAVETYKSITKKPTTPSEVTTTATQIEGAKGSLKADFISKMTFEEDAPAQSQQVQNKVQAPAPKP